MSVSNLSVYSFAHLCSFLKDFSVLRKEFMIVFMYFIGF